MSIKKQFLKSKDVCKVTFRIPTDRANDHTDAYIVGSFNEWKAEPMKRLKDGSFKIVKDLDKNNEYLFRYLLGESEWINDEEADKEVPSQFRDALNAIVEV